MSQALLQQCRHQSYVLACRPCSQLGFPPWGPRQDRTQRICVALREGATSRDILTAVLQAALLRSAAEAGAQAAAVQDWEALTASSARRARKQSARFQVRSLTESCCWACPVMPITVADLWLMDSCITNVGH